MVGLLSKEAFVYEQSIMAFITILRTASLCAYDIREKFAKKF